MDAGRYNAGTRRDVGSVEDLQIEVLRILMAEDRCEERDLGCFRPVYGVCDDGVRRCFQHFTQWWWQEMAPEHETREELIEARKEYNKARLKVAQSGGSKASGGTCKVVCNKR